MPPTSPQAAARQITFLEYMITTTASITNHNLPSPSVRAFILNEVFADVNRFLNERDFPSENADEEYLSSRNDDDVGGIDPGYEADDEAEVDEEEEEEKKEEDAEPRDWRTGGEGGEGLEIEMEEEEEEEDDRGSLHSYHYESDDYDPGRNSDLDHYNFPEP